MGLIQSLCLLLLAFTTAAAPQADPALQQLFQLQEAAWNAGDGIAWAAAFTDKADFINIRGDVFHGREAIADRHVVIFTSFFKGSHVATTIRSITQPVPTVAIIETDNEITQFKALPPGIAATSPGVLKTRMKFIAVKHGDQWRLIAAQNTAVLPPLAPPH
jgi:uncharacterized protein (TIGR02246 family)